MGSFVPCASASVRVRRRLFALLGSQDSPENNASTFQMQMMEVSSTLQQCTSDSLVILDELAVGTNAPEAAALGWAITEALVRAGPAAVIATHFSSLTRMSHVYPQIRNYFFATCASEGGRHRLVGGVTPVKHYGLSVASLSSLPPSLLRHATHLAHVITAGQTRGAATVPPAVSRRAAVCRLAHKLLELAKQQTSVCESPESRATRTAQENARSRLSHSSIQTENDDVMKNTTTISTSQRQNDASTSTAAPVVGESGSVSSTKSSKLEGISAKQGSVSSSSNDISNEKNQHNVSRISENVSSANDKSKTLTSEHNVTNDNISSSGTETLTNESIIDEKEETRLKAIMENLLQDFLTEINAP